MTTHFHKADLPPDLDLGDCLAIDTETMGLKPGRDRLCLMQLSAGDGDAHRRLKGGVKVGDSRVAREGSECTLPAWGATVRGMYGTAEAGTRTAYVQCAGPRGKLPCASGTYSTQEAGTRSPYAQHGGPETYVSA